MYSEITNSIKISVNPVFLEEQSDPDDFHYVWAYHVCIENQRTDTVQLMTRRWHITDSQGRINEVRGEGVVGESHIPNGRHAVWNNHAGEGVAAESVIPNGRNAVPDNHAGGSVVSESRLPNGRNAVPDNHAGEGKVGAESRLPNGRNAVWNGHAGEGVVSESFLRNARNAVSDNHAGEGVVSESSLRNARNAVGCPAIHNSVRNDYISGCVLRVSPLAARYLDVSRTCDGITEATDIKGQSLSRQHRNKQKCERGEYAALWGCCHQKHLQ